MILTLLTGGLPQAAGTIAPDADGIIIQDPVPWSYAHPRHDHQLVFPLKDGRLLLVWCEYYVTSPSLITRERYAKASSDDMPCRISAMLSADRGRTWSERFTLQDNIGLRNVKHPNLLRLPSGELILCFTVWNNNQERLIYIKRSNDDGETWTLPEKMSLLPGFNNINNDHIFRMSTGRIILPSFNTPSIWDTNDHQRALCHYSDDDGKTWKVSDNRVDLPKRGAEEPSIVELKDGSLLMLLRTSLGSLYRAYSRDGGQTWSEAEDTNLISPAAPPLVKRIPATGDLLLVWNRSYEEGHHHQGERTPLCSAISRDEGRTWEHVKVIESVPGGSAAYASAYCQDDEVLVGYYYQSKGMGGASQIRLKIIPLAWFYR